jgi:uncharacterized membrane protein
MDAGPIAASGAQGIPNPIEDQRGPLNSYRRIRERLLEGLLFLLPIALTFWVVRWLYSTLEYYVIEPIAKVVLWKIRLSLSETELPFWFETFVVPVIALLLLLFMFYCLGFFVHRGLRRSIDWVLLRIPLISVIYDSFQAMVKTLEKPPERNRPQKLVLVEFPHPGIKVPAFVTATCRDIETHKVLLCVYVPTTPMPTAGYFLLVPEENVTELDWSVEQTLQAIVSGGLTTPPEVHYFRSKPLAGMTSVAGTFTNESQQHSSHEG